MNSPFKFPFPEVMIQILREGEWGQSCHSAATLTTRMIYVHTENTFRPDGSTEITKIINWTSPKWHVRHFWRYDLQTRYFFISWHDEMSIKSGRFESKSWISLPSLSLSRHTIIVHTKICLKVLSSEMDPAEIRLIPWDFFKGIVASGF